MTWVDLLVGALFFVVFGAGMLGEAWWRRRSGRDYPW